MTHLYIVQRWQFREQLLMVTLWGIFPKHKQFSAQNKFVLQHVFKKWNGRNIIQATCYCLRRLAEKCLDEYGGEVTS